MNTAVLDIYVLCNSNSGKSHHWHCAPGYFIQIPDIFTLMIIVQPLIDCFMLCYRNNHLSSPFPSLSSVLRPSVQDYLTSAASQPQGTAVKKTNDDITALRLKKFSLSLVVGLVSLYEIFLYILDYCGFEKNTIYKFMIFIYLSQIGGGAFPSYIKNIKSCYLQSNRASLSSSVTSGRKDNKGDLDQDNFFFDPEKKVTNQVVIVTKETQGSLSKLIILILSHP